MQKDNFNSIKVRLKLTGTKVPDICKPFQFHKGTIKTKSSVSVLTSLSYFNSIKVRLKPVYSTYYAALEAHFNSIKVRLKLLLFCRFKALLRDFNSIKVRLKRTLLSVVDDYRLYFNSIKVRLKHCEECKKRKRTDISIP